MIAVFAVLGRGADGADHGVEDSMVKLACKNALIIEPSLVSTKKQLLLAHYLTKKAFADGSNIARDFKLEFLLWLSAKRDIKSALLASRPKGSEVLLVIFEGGKKKILEELKAQEITGRGKKLQDNFDAMALENISLGRVL